VRFFCDENVDAAVAARLRRLGHDAWTVPNAGLVSAKDDYLIVYTMERRACLITHDREFSLKRRRRVIGRHIWLTCAEWEAADVLETCMHELEPLLTHNPDVWVRIGVDGIRDSSHAWE
jgi:predicted nuclease of predicted toxin-antitoxin system